MLGCHSKRIIQVVGTRRSSTNIDLLIVYLYQENTCMVDLGQKFGIPPEKFFDIVHLSLFREQAQIVGEPSRNFVAWSFCSSPPQIDVYSSGDRR